MPGMTEDLAHHTGPARLAVETGFVLRPRHGRGAERVGIAETQDVFHGSSQDFWSVQILSALGNTAYAGWEGKSGLSALRQGTASERPEPPCRQPAAHKPARF